jgi:hypothetical protein
MNGKETENLGRKDVSIECAKAYSKGSGDHAALQALREKLERIGSENKSHSTVLLVDDVTYEDKTFDFDEYADWLKIAGFGDAEIYRESQIKDSSDEVRGLIDFSLLSPEVTDSLQHNRYTSPLFIASWFLLRLGRIEDQGFPAHLRAERLYNILPESFKPGEDQALEIIRATPYAQATENIEYQFISE